MNKQNIRVESVKEITPHNEALYEAGKALLVDSITVSREFCKFMITIATSAIPIHLGLLKFVLPENYTLKLIQGIFASIPAGLFLLSAIIFAIGYYPQTGKLSLDIMEEIAKERMKTIKSRKKMTIVGFTTFVLAALSMIICIIYYLITLN